MRIVFSVAFDDVLAFQRFHLAQSPTIRAYRRTMFAIAVVIGILCFVGILRLLGDASIVPVLCGAVGGLVVVVVYMVSPKARSMLWNRPLEWLSRRVYAEGKNLAVFGPREFELDDDGLVARSPVFESTMLWKAIERIASTGEHTFIYLGAENALVIPRSKVIEGDYDAFLAELNRRHAAS